MLRNFSMTSAAAVLLLSIAACDGKPDAGARESESVGDSSSSSSSIADAATSAVNPDEQTGADSSGSNEGGGFIMNPDGGGVAVECSVWEQDCPTGEKCMPWANDGGNAWNATRCSPVDENAGQVGDECTVEGSGVTGVDTCALGSMCYYVDSETNVGRCVAFCEGSEANPSCEQGSVCSIANDGVLTLCRPECDPILQPCESIAACLPASGGELFTCIIDASGEDGAAGDPCEFLNACDPGLYCADSATVPGCSDATGCCTEFCDLTAENPGAACSLGGGQECVPWYAEGEAPPGYAHVGVCALPQ